MIGLNTVRTVVNGTTYRYYVARVSENGKRIHLGLFRYNKFGREKAKQAIRNYKQQRKNQFKRAA